MIKILLTGAKGQFGIAFKELLKKNYYELPIKIFDPDRNELDISKETLCNSFISSIAPDWIINAAAFTNVDKAEEFPDKANLINGIAPLYLSKALSKYGGKLIQISTDFVFDGKKNIPYNILDKRNPINSYGKSKEKGEIAVEEILHPKGQGLILRTSWLMGPSRNNFLLTILKLIKNQKKIKVVSDQFGSPTSTYTLAEVVYKIIADNYLYDKPLEPYLHCCDDGQTSWFEIAFIINSISREIGLVQKSPEIIPIKSSLYKSIASRPKYSVLSNKIIKEKLNYKTQNWDTRIREVLIQIFNNEIS